MREQSESRVKSIMFGYFETLGLYFKCLLFSQIWKNVNNKRKIDPFFFMKNRDLPMMGRKEMFCSGKPGHQENDNMKGLVKKFYGVEKVEIKPLKLIK